jgi:small subunit ribosomal protein S8
MSATDPVGDFLTQIRNAVSAGKDSTLARYSKLKGNIAQVLKAEGYIEDFKLETVEGKPQLSLKLRRTGKQNAITGIRRISKPGLRRYVGSQDIPRVLGGLGVSILSTPKGVMSGHEAKKNNVGGELIAYIW